MHNGNRDSETSIMGSMLGWEIDLRPRRKVCVERAQYAFNFFFKMVIPF
jgi:hypothetical protein